MVVTSGFAFKKLPISEVLTPSPQDAHFYKVKSNGDRGTAANTRL